MTVVHPIAHPAKSKHQKCRVVGLKKLCGEQEVAIF